MKESNLSNKLVLESPSSNPTYNKISAFSLSKNIAFLFLLINLGAISCSTSTNLYRPYINYGASYEAKGRYDSAIVSYTTAIKYDTHSPEAYEKRALAYSKMDKHAEAMADIEKAIDLSKRSWNLYKSRAIIYEKQGIYNRAIEDYSIYISKADKKTTDYYLGNWGRGKCYLYSKQYNEAILDFSASIQSKPTDFNLYSWRALCYYEQQRYAEAAKDYEVFLQNNPKSYKERFQLGVCYTKLNIRDKASSVFMFLAEYDPSIKINFPGEHVLDFFDLDLRRKVVIQSIKDATLNLEEAKSIDSKSLSDIKLKTAFDNLETAWGFGSSFNREDKIMLDTILSKYFYVYPRLKTKPNVPEFVRKFTVQATSAVEEKDYSRAIELYQRSLSISPYYPLARFNMAMLYATIGDYKKAIQQMNNYIHLVPDASDARAAQDKIYEWEIKVKD